MTESRGALGLGQQLARRLYPLPLGIGVLISLGFPAIYYVHERGALRHAADIYAHELAQHLEDISVEIPTLWKYQIPKYSQILADFLPHKDVKAVQVLDESGRKLAEYQYVAPTSARWWTVPSSAGSASVLLSGRHVGTVRVEVSHAVALEETLVLFLLSAAIGVGLALVAYRFPVRVVTGMEQEIHALVTTLNGAHAESERLRLAAEASEQRFRGLVQGVNAIVYEAEPETGRFRFVSQQAEAILGYPVAEWLADPNFRAAHLHPEDRAQILDLVRNETAAGRDFECEYRMRAADGRVVWLRDRVQVVKDAQGHPQLLRGVTVDVTEHRRAQEAQRESEERYRLLFEGNPHPMWVYDLDSLRFLAVNDAAVRRYGYSREEFLAMTLKDIRPPEDVPALLENVAKVTEGLDEAGAWRHRKKDGTIIDVEITSHTLTFGGRRAEVVLSQDITQRKRAEAALAERTHQLEAVRAVTAEITRELDLRALLELITRRAADLAGAVSGTVFLWDEASQRLIAEAWHGIGSWRGEVGLRLGEGVAGVVAQRRTGQIVNDYRTSPYAHPVTLQRSAITAVLAEPLLYHDRLIGVITINNEGTGRAFAERDREVLGLFAAHAAIAIENARLYQEIQHHAAELEARVQERTRELEAARVQAEEASRHKSEFLANMSHELRTPLSSILGFSELLLEQTADLLSAKQTRYLRNVHTSGQHLLQLINDILDLSKVEAGKIVLERKALPVAESLENILVIVRGLANKRAQIIETEIEPDLPSLSADPVRFKQILFNLLSNAVKFTPDGGTITVTARRASSLEREATLHAPRSTLHGPRSTSCLKSA